MKYLLSSVAGAALGYFIAQGLLSRKYEADLNHEVAEAQMHYREFYKHKEADFSKLPYLLEKIKDFHGTPEYDSAVAALLDFDGHEAFETEQVVIPESSAVYVGTEDFDEVNLPEIPRGYTPPSPVDYNAISKKRAAAAMKSMAQPMLGGQNDPYAPFVISEEQYIAGGGENDEDEWNDSTTLVFYMDDDILADGVTNEIMAEEQLETFISRANLEKFGEKSGDPKKLYVRCHVYKTDFEVVLSDDGYSAVTGLPLPMEGG